MLAFISDKREYYRSLENVYTMEHKLKAMLDASPLLCAIYDENLQAIEANEVAATLFGLADKQIYIERLYDLCPEVQPCGTPSMQKAREVLVQAFKEGRAVFEWMHCTLDKQTMIPCLCTLERVSLGDRHVVMAYLRDLRYENEMMHLLQESIDKEQIANRAKTRFLARMSHEIRTPISAVMGISEMQLRGRQLPPAQEEAFAKIYDSSKILLSIVNDILDLSKIEAGKMELLLGEYDVATLVSDAAQLHLMYSERKDVEFQVGVDPSLPAKMRGDVLRIRQIAMNLLSNAFKYTEAGYVRLAISKGTDSHGIQLVLTIRDTGHGMSADQLAKLRTEYVRHHEEKAPSEQGTGLGIPIVYSLVQMMGGQMEFESEPEVGTCVTVRLPQEAMDEEVLGEKLAQELERFEGLFWSEQKDMEFTPTQMSGRVLVVDDVDTNLYVAEAMLSSFGLEIDLAESAQDALALVAQNGRYDVIFMDHMMPYMDGVECTAILRESGYEGPIVMLTANALKGQAEIFSDCGFSGFMSKPIDIKILQAYLHKFIH
jgi:signal transduction histidine kinase/CheY-like chemotaxis protein